MADKMPPELLARFQKKDKKDPKDENSAPLAGLMVGLIDVRRLLKQINDRIK